MRIGTVLLLVFAACTTPPETAVTTTEGPPLRYLALGDSYTIGESVGPDQRWPVRLGRQLENSGFSLVEVTVIARTGWTTSELDAGIDRVAPQGSFDLVTLAIGVNNQFRGLSLDEYRADFVALLDRAIGFAGGDRTRVIVVSIPDWGVTPFGSSYDPTRVADEIDMFNVSARQETEAVGATWVDITPISRRGDPGLVAADGLHPSAAQYAAWVDLILPAALAVGL